MASRCASTAQSNHLHAPNEIHGNSQQCTLRLVTDTSTGGAWGSRKQCQDSFLWVEQVCVAVTFFTRIPEVRGSNLGGDISHPDVLGAILFSPSRQMRDSTASFQVPSNSSIIPPFMVQLLIPSLNFNSMLLRNSDNRLLSQCTIAMWPACTPASLTEGTGLGFCWVRGASLSRTLRTNLASGVNEREKVAILFLFYCSLLRYIVIVFSKCCDDVASFRVFSNSSFVTMLCILYLLTVS
jgi:hypothetical protein